MAAGRLLLPATGWVSGRTSARQSHWWYIVADPPDRAAERFTDSDGAVLVELRSTGGQTVAPPGVHESGESIVWHTFTEPAPVALAELRGAVKAVAAAALLARHWPGQGTRQEAFLALAGGLLRGGWDETRVERFIEAVAAATGDEEARKRVQVVAQTAAKVGGEDKTTGWRRLGELLGDGGRTVIAQVREWLGLASALAVPIPGPPPWPDPPGDEAFHGLPGRIVRAIEPVSEASPAALLVQTLVAFGNAAGRSAHFTVEADRHHANEFAVVVGRTAKARKGTSWGHVYRLFREADEPWASDHIQSGLSSGEGLIWAVRDPVRKLERVKERGEPVRYEEVEADPGVTDKRLLVYEPEYASVLKQTERQGNTLSTTLRQAWDGGDLRTLVKNSPARATGPHISVVGHITVEEVRRYLTLTETANGFGNRHLWVCAERSKTLPDGGNVDPETAAQLQRELADAIAFARTAGVVRRDDEAGELWRGVYGQLSEGRPGLAGALLARGEAHVMRLALLYALMDRSSVIGAGDLLAALALWDYVERSVVFVFGDDLGDPVADDLLRLLRPCPEGLTRTDLSQYLGRNQSADRIGRALGLLLQHRLVRCERHETGGRPAELWFPVVRGR